MQLRATEHSSLSKFILLGVNSYIHDSLANLNSPIHDVKRMNTILMDSSSGGVPSKNILVLSEEISKSDFLKSIKKLIDESQESETLTFFFSGHGLISENTFFLCLKNTNIDDLINTSISSNELDNQFTNFKGRGVFFILDCCRSAGFAELAPRFFSNLQGKDFKILLSAARSEQNSWELEQEQGTLFTNHLINVLSGVVQISQTSGLIYFSELFDYLSNQIEEDFRIKYPTAPIQEIVFTGVYNKDPLLFVHKNLTLQQIEVKTTRYSKEYLQRLLRRIVVTTLVVLSFGLGIIYSIMDKSTYVQVVNEKIILFRGIPNLNLLGFPRVEWTFDSNVDDIKPNSILRDGVALMGGLDRSIFPTLFRELKDYKTAEFMIDIGDTLSARTLITKSLLNPNENTSDLLVQLKRIVQPQDSTLLISVFNKKESDIQSRKFVLGNLARIDLPKTIEFVSNWPLNPVEDFYNQEVIISNLDNASRTEMEQYMGFLLKGEFISNIVNPIFEIAISHDLELKEEDLTIFLANVQFEGGDGLGYYMRNINGESLSKSLQVFLDETHYKADNQIEKPNWEATNFAISALRAYAGPIEICEEIEDFAINTYNEEALRLGLEQCDNMREDFLNNQAFLWNNFQNATNMIEELSRNKIIDSKFVLTALESTDTPYHQLILIKSLGYLKDTLAIPRLLQEIPFNGSDILPSTRIAAIEVLREMGVPYAKEVNNFPDEWEEVIVQALRWQFETEPNEVYTTLENLFDGEDNYRVIVMTLAGHKPSKQLLNIARKKLKKSGPSRMNAGALLGMFGEVEEVVKLLTSEDSVLRNHVSNFVSYNDGFDQILHLLNNRNLYPNKVIDVLQKQKQIFQKAKVFLKKLPPQGLEWGKEIIFKKYEEETKDGTYIAIKHKYGYERFKN